MELNDIFAENLKTQMEKNNLTQVMVAEGIGVTQAAVSLWLKGDRTPKISVIEKLCALFKCNRSDLLETKSKTNIPKNLENNIDFVIRLNDDDINNDEYMIITMYREIPPKNRKEFLSKYVEMLSKYSKENK